MKPSVIAMVPARLGSERLKKKNLLEINGVPLVLRALYKAKELHVFDEVWANSESSDIGRLVMDNGFSFHLRPESLGLGTATSEDFVYEFMLHHPCDYLVQIHSIAPLLTRHEISNFTHTLVSNGYDTLLSGVNEQIQCMMDGEPLNFSSKQMDPTQKLHPIQRISWSITGWRTSSYLQQYQEGKCATFHGNMGFYELSRASGLVIKYEEDYFMAKALAGAGIGE